MTIGLIVLALVIVGFIFVLKNRRKFLVTKEEYEKEKRKRKNADLLNKSGEKIRWQYFNTYIYIQLSFIPAVPVMIIMQELRKGNFDVWESIVEMFGATPVLLVMYGFFIGPFIALSILNRLCFGKVLGVVDNPTLFLNDREININDIIEIVYHPRVMSRRKVSCSFATFYINSSTNTTDSFNILHFPLYGVRKIKKFNSNIKLSFDKYIWFLIFLPTFISAVFGFLLG